MNLRVLVITILVFLLLFFGINNISNSRNETKYSDIHELKVLQYLPKNNKLLFVSNYKISDIINNFKKKSNQEKLANYTILRNSIFGYLGIDLGKNKLIDIYNNELAISTFYNKEKSKDDILIIFKIKPGKNLNDLLNLQNDIDKIDEIIPIYRENKLNYLKFIYATKDNYIIASTDKKLILNSIESKKNKREDYSNYFKEFNQNFHNQHNILLTKESDNSSIFSKKVSQKNTDNIIASTFKLNEKNLIFESYLINNKKDLNISSYESLINRNKINNNNFQVSIFSDLNSSLEYLKNLNEFEEEFLEELNQNLNQNILLLQSSGDWIIAFENNKPKKVNEIENLNNYKKYSLQKDDKIFSIYSKDILEFKEDTLRKISYDDIYAVESDKLSFISNNLNKVGNINDISNEFFNIKNNNEQNFLYQRIYMKDLNSNQGKNFNYSKFTYLNNINFPFDNIIKDGEFTEIIKQSIPETIPIIFRETSIEFF